MDRSDIAKRMKGYEKSSERYLTRRTPVILRLDGCHFHSFTKGFDRPYDDGLISAMQQTTKYLCENIQGCVLGYCQSDEITLLLVDYKKLNSEAWFDYRQNKIESVAASMCTMAFNKFFGEFCRNYGNDKYQDNGTSRADVDMDKLYKLALNYNTAVKKGAYFDCRAFNIPKEEVTNNFYWRQLDCSRNSVQMLGQAHFSHKELHGKTCGDIQDMLMTRKGINWNDIPTHKKRGTCVVKTESESGKRPQWTIDLDIPIFAGEGREYIEKLVNINA